MHRLSMNLSPLQCGQVTRKRTVRDFWCQLAQRIQTASTLFVKFFPIPIACCSRLCPSSIRRNLVGQLAGIRMKHQVILEQHGPLILGLSTPRSSSCGIRRFVNVLDARFCTWPSSFAVGPASTLSPAPVTSSSVRRRARRTDVRNRHRMSQHLHANAWLQSDDPAVHECDKITLLPWPHGWSRHCSPTFATRTSAPAPADDLGRASWKNGWSPARP